MRPSLLPGLLAAARRNLDRGAAGAAAVRDRPPLSARRGRARATSALSLAVVLAGEKTPRGWATGKARAFDAFDAKAEALALLAEAGAPVDKLQVMGEAGPQFHPGQSATLRLGPKTVLARFGMLHPGDARGVRHRRPVAAVELFLDAIPAKQGRGSFARAAYAPPALQAVTRDFAFLVPAELPAGDLRPRGQGRRQGEHRRRAPVRRLPRRRACPRASKSLAIEVTLQPGEKSYDRRRAQGDRRPDQVASRGGKPRAGAQGQR